MAETTTNNQAPQKTWSTWAQQFIPALFICLRDGYSLKSFWRDLLAGIGLALIALPMNMAFAIACGLPPEYGLYTAIVAGALAALFGGSPVSIGGPTGAFVVIIYTILEQHGYEGLATATCMAGVFLLIMAFIGCGQLLQLVSYPVIRGFTSGIAIVIMGLQVRDFLGLHPADSATSHFISSCLVNWDCLHLYNPYAAMLGIGSLGFLIAMRAYFPRFPSYPLVVVLAACIVAWFSLPVDTIGTRFGSISPSLPTPALPDLSWHAMQSVFPAAFTIALLSALESLLCAVVADEMAGTRHSSNGELFGQGIANIGAILFQGIPATGAIARTAANIRMGALTPVASLVHALVMLLIVMFFAQYAEKIPLSALAAVLLVVAWQMSEFGRIRALLHAPKGDLIVFFMTFFLTIFVDLTVAVEVGVLLSVFFFIQQLRNSTSSLKAYQSMVDTPELPAPREAINPALVGNQPLPPGVDFLTLHGPLFFGTSDALQEVQKQLQSTEREVKGRVWILDMSDVPFVDASGIQALFNLDESCTRNGARLILVGAKETIRTTLEQADHEGRFKEDKLFATLQEALKSREKNEGTE